MGYYLLRPRPCYIWPFISYGMYLYHCSLCI
nr:MAG TPA: hypothetical protein [Caudoviricetes sp.]